MKKWKLLLGIAAMMALMGCAVYWGSSYQPVVGEYREIEEIWALEDERGESKEALVTELWCNGVPLGYDAENQRFYCPLGLENGAEWPEIRLTAQKSSWGG